MVTMRYDGATIRMDGRTLIALVHEAEEGGGVLGRDPRTPRVCIAG